MYSVPDLCFSSSGCFKDPKNFTKSVACLNAMIGNALELVPDCLEYMENVTDPQVYRFCAIPQLMAIGKQI
jgi:farnesyl-diphosphate farnesyltransferase